MTQNNCKEKKRDEKQYRDFLTSCLREAKEKIDGGGGLHPGIFGFETRIQEFNQ